MSSTPTLDEFGRTELIRFTIDQDLEKIDTFLGTFPTWKNYPDHFGMNAAHYAAASGNQELFMYLIRRGVTYTSVDQAGESVLHKFARIQTYAPITFLSQKGVSLDLQNNRGNSPLHIACNSWNLDQVQSYVKNFSNLEIQNRDNNTPLHVAIDRFASSDTLHKSELARLIAADADTLKKPFLERVKLWFLNIDDVITNQTKKTLTIFSRKPIIYYDEKRGIEVITLLLDAGSSLKIRNDNNLNAIDLVKKKKNTILTKLFLDKRLINENEL